MGLDLVGPGVKNMIQILHNSKNPNIVAWKHKWTSDKHGNTGRGVIDEGNHLHLNFIDALSTGATWENYSSGNLLNTPSNQSSLNLNVPDLNLSSSLEFEESENTDFNVLDEYRNKMLSDVMSSSPIRQTNLFQNRETDSFTEFIKRPKDSKGADMFGPRQAVIALQPWDDWKTIRQMMDSQDPDPEKLKIKT